jgi:hypothetical protein
MFARIATLAGLALCLLAPPGRASAGAVSPDPAQFRCLALNVYHEARGEPLDGMVAVALVTMHRVSTPSFPNTVCGVVKQSHSPGSGECQFSWYCDGVEDNPEDQEAWLVARAVARAAMAGEIPDIVKDVRYFARCDVERSWISKLDLVARIGDHCFYRDPVLATEAFDERKFVEFTDVYDFVVVTDKAAPDQGEVRLVAVPYVPPPVTKKAAPCVPASKGFVASIWKAFTGFGTQDCDGQKPSGGM